MDVLGIKSILRCLEFLTYDTVSSICKSESIHAEMTAFILCKSKIASVLVLTRLLSLYFYNFEKPF